MRNEVLHLAFRVFYWVWPFLLKRKSFNCMYKANASFFIHFLSSGEYIHWASCGRWESNGRVTRKLFKHHGVASSPWIIFLLLSLPVVNKQGYGEAPFNWSSLINLKEKGTRTFYILCLTVISLILTDKRQCSRKHQWLAECLIDQNNWLYCNSFDTLYCSNYSGFSRDPYSCFAFAITPRTQFLAPRSLRLVTLGHGSVPNAFCLSTYNTL